MTLSPENNPYIEVAKVVTASNVRMKPKHVLLQLVLYVIAVASLMLVLPSLLLWKVIGPGLIGDSSE
ncbi:MAG: hypothetical protein QXP80_07020 [Zestosphaera sp.]